MTTEHRKAPKRAVVEILRVGEWGKVKYHHTLSCGHTEVRQRATTAPKLACVWCLRAEKKDEELRVLAPAAPEILPEVIDIDATLSENEVQVARHRASLAKLMGVPMEAVDISVQWRGGSLVIQGAVVFLSANDVARLSRGGFDV
jgi:hypothetical protein